MNLTELKAIDSRLRRVAAGEKVIDVYDLSELQRGEPHSFDRQRLADAQYDTTLIDEGYLQSLGFEHVRSHSLWERELPGNVWVGVQLDRGAVHVGQYRRENVTTRGQLLQLLMGLGVFDE